MKLLIRAVVTGFGLSLGSMIFKKVSQRLGLDDEKAKADAERVNKQDGAVDPGLQTKYS